MFQIIIQSKRNPNIKIIRSLEVDFLPEVEAEALNIAESYYKGVELVLIHVGDLKYEIYEIDKPLAVMEIKSI